MGYRGMHAIISEADRVYVKGFSFCFYCQSLCESVQVDHIYPVSLGGNSHISNLTGACFRCNVTKHQKTIPELLNMLNRRRVDLMIDARKLLRSMKGAKRCG